MNRSNLEAWGGKPENYAARLKVYARRVKLDGAVSQCKYDSTPEAQAT